MSQRGPIAQPLAIGLERLSIGLRLELYRSVEVVSNPPGHAQRFGSFLGKVAIPDPLHPPGDGNR